MEKVNKLEGARGGELMYAVLAKQNNSNNKFNKRGSGGRDGGRRDGERSKRPRQVRHAEKESRGEPGESETKQGERGENATKKREEKNFEVKLGANQRPPP